MFLFPEICVYQARVPSLLDRIQWKVRDRAGSFYDRSGNLRADGLRETTHLNMNPSTQPSVGPIVFVFGHDLLTEWHTDPSAPKNLPHETRTLTKDIAWEPIHGSGRVQLAQKLPSPSF